MKQFLFLNPDLFSKPQTAKNHHYKTSRDQNAVIVGSFEQIKLLAVTKCCGILMKDKLISTCCWMNGYENNYNKHLPYNLLLDVHITQRQCSIIYILCNKKLFLKRNIKQETIIREARKKPGLTMKFVRRINHTHVCSYEFYILDVFLWL